MCVVCIFLQYACARSVMEQTVAVYLFFVAKNTQLLI